MSELGDVLELLFAGPDPVVTVHAVIEERRDEAIAERLGQAEMRRTEEQLGEMPRVVKVVAAPAVAMAAGRSAIERIRRTPKPPTLAPESRLEAWIDETGRARLERRWQGDGGLSTLTTIGPVDRGPTVSGSRRLDLAPPGAQAPAPGPTDAERHFGHPLLRSIVAQLHLTGPRAGEVAGRRVVEVDATARSAGGLWPHWLPYGAERYELSFDREYADLLAYVAFAGDRAYASGVATAVTYGGPVDVSP